jgi:hypothetical protein
MKKYNITSWVEQENTPRKRSFREAVHTILFAIANNKNLTCRNDHERRHSPCNQI